MLVSFNTYDKWLLNSGFELCTSPQHPPGIPCYCLASNPENWVSPADLRSPHAAEPLTHHSLCYRSTLLLGSMAFTGFITIDKLSPHGCCFWGPQVLIYDQFCSLYGEELKDSIDPSLAHRTLAVLGLYLHILLFNQSFCLFLTADPADGSTWQSIGWNVMRDWPRGGKRAGLQHQERPVSWSLQLVWKWAPPARWEGKLQ